MGKHWNKDYSLGTNPSQFTSVTIYNCFASVLSWRAKYGQGIYPREETIVTDISEFVSSLERLRTKYGIKFVTSYLYRKIQS